MPRPKSGGGGGGGSRRGQGRDAPEAHDYAHAWAPGDYAEDGRSGANNVDDPASSPSAAPFPIKLAMWDLGQCDRKRCTGTRLVHQGVVKELRVSCLIDDRIIMVAFFNMLAQLLLMLNISSL